MTPERFSRINPEAVKQAIDLVEFAQRYTQLRQISRQGEFAGPCPRCGGEDRFHVKGDRFFCRQCFPRGGDVIDLVQLLHGVDFREACRRLGADAPTAEGRRIAMSPIRPVSERSAPETDATFQQSAQRTLQATARRLASVQGREGQAYLAERGFKAETWRAYRLGYGQAFHPARKRNEPAIFIPWLSADGGAIYALRHRFIAPDIGKHERYTLKSGSAPTLFGLHLLQPRDHLVIVEGEFNCIALHQCGVQALSVGSQSGSRRAEVLDLLMPALSGSRHIHLWFDQPEFGLQLLEQLAKLGPFRKEDLHIVESPQDANELLQRDVLLGFAAARNLNGRGGA